MYPMKVILLLAAAALYFGVSSASPTAWPEDKLEAINTLRVSGASEVTRIIPTHRHDYAIDSFPIQLLNHRKLKVL